jgi:hypothetical protein
VGLTVDVQRARTANSFATIVVKDTGRSPLLIKPSFRTSNISRKDILFDSIYWIFNDFTSGVGDAIFLM